MGLDSALAGTAIIAAPDVDGTIGTTGVACAIVTPSDTSVRGHLVTAVETLGLITTLLASIPEVEMLDTSGGESLAAGLVVPCDVEDLVLVTLVLEDHLTLAVVAVDVVIVVDINSADHVLGVDVASGNTTSALANLHAVFLLACHSAPGEDGGGGTSLAGDSNGLVGVDGNTHDVVGVMVGVLSNVLGGAIDLAATEEFLGVVGVVKDDTESSSHVDGVALSVEVDVLLGVSATVAVDVLESVGLVGTVIAEIVVGIGLSDLADPGFDGHELLADLLVDLKEVILGTIVVLSTVAGHTLAGFFVVAHTSTVFHVSVVVELAWSRST